MVSLFRDRPTGLTFSADDKKLIYSLWHGFSGGQFGEITFADGSVKRLALEEAQNCRLSPKGEKLAYSSFSAGSKIWRKTCFTRRLPAVEPIPSSRAQFEVNTLRTERALPSRLYDRDGRSLDQQ